MAFEITYDEHLDCLIATVTGIFEYPDIPQLIKELIIHKNFRTNINQLFDCRNGSLKFSTQDLERTADDFGHFAKELGFERKLAFVVSRDLEFGQLRQYEAFLEPIHGVLTRVFRSIEDAHNWLKG